LIANLKVFFRCFTVFTIALIVLKKSFDPKLFLQSIGVPIFKAISGAQRILDEALLSVESRGNLIKICKDLTNENVTLKLQWQRDQYLRDQIASLEQLMGIGENIFYKKIYARVIKRTTSAWFESIIINKGSDHGIRENALAIASCGIIGKVTEIFKNFSIITLASSPKFRLAVVLENFTIPMIFTGTSNCLRKNSESEWEIKAAGIIRDIPANAQKFMSIGTKIFAASLCETTFNLPIGTIAQVCKQKDEIFLQSIINLPEEINNLQEILIIIPDDLQEKI
jgi:rod shape-determining protein MreC